MECHPLYSVSCTNLCSCAWQKSKSNPFSSTSRAHSWGPVVLFMSGSFHPLMNSGLACLRGYWMTRNSFTQLTKIDLQLPLVSTARCSSPRRTTLTLFFLESQSSLTEISRKSSFQSLRSAKGARIIKTWARISAKEWLSRLFARLTTSGTKLES